MWKLGEGAIPRSYTHTRAAFALNKLIPDCLMLHREGGCGDRRCLCSQGKRKIQIRVACLHSYLRWHLTAYIVL